MSPASYQTAPPRIPRIATRAGDDRWGLERANARHDALGASLVTCPSRCIRTRRRSEPCGASAERKPSRGGSSGSPIERRSWSHRSNRENEWSRGATRTLSSRIGGSTSEGWTARRPDDDQRITASHANSLATIAGRTSHGDASHASAATTIQLDNRRGHARPGRRRASPDVGSDRSGENAGSGGSAGAVDEPRGLTV